MQHEAICGCGQLKATCEGAPLRVSVCHCLECKRRTGSAFSWNARYAADKVSVSGAAQAFARVGDEGSKITHHFCPTCGISVYYTNSDLDGMIAIPVGAFATADFPAPGYSVYHSADRRCGWLEIVAKPLTIIA